MTASIVSYGLNDYRLILTNDETGVKGISLQNGSGSSLVERFGWKNKDVSLKHAITGGAQSDGFTSSTEAIKSLLGLSTTQSGDIVIDGQSVSLDLAIDSLEDIKNKINAAGIAGVTASVTESTTGVTTSYRLQIEGTQNVSDSQNILDTLGILQKGVSDVNGTTSAITMTEDGAKITASTRLAAIDGYFSHTTGDHVTISGVDHAGNAVTSNFDIEATSTVQDLLDAIETAFEAQGSEVSVHVTSDGKIQVENLEPGTSQLAVTLTSQVGTGTLTWGEFSHLDVVRKRELIQGQDASILIDGVNVTSEDNTVTDVLPGITLNLLGAASDTTITLNVDRDIVRDHKQGQHVCCRIQRRGLLYFQPPDLRRRRGKDGRNPFWRRHPFLCEIGPLHHTDPVRLGRGIRVCHPRDGGRQSQQGRTAHRRH